MERKSEWVTAVTVQLYSHLNRAGVIHTCTSALVQNNNNNKTSSISVIYGQKWQKQFCAWIYYFQKVRKLYQKQIVVKEEKIKNDDSWTSAKCYGCSSSHHPPCQRKYLSGCCCFWFLVLFRLSSLKSEHVTSVASKQRSQKAALERYACHVHVHVCNNPTKFELDCTENILAKKYIYFVQFQLFDTSWSWTKVRITESGLKGSGAQYYQCTQFGLDG